MSTVKLSDSEFEKLETDQRHAALIAAISKLTPDTANLERLIAHGFEAIKALASSDNTPDLRPLMSELTKGLMEMKKESKPRSFVIVRDDKGLIEKVEVN